MSKLPRFFVYIPIISGVICTLTIITTYIISRSLNHYPEWMWLPVISLMGFKMPERVIYAIGFTSAGLGYLVIAYQYIPGMRRLYMYIFFYIYPCIYNRTNVLGRTYAVYVGSILTYICIGGLIIQACIPLQSDILDDDSKITFQSLIHQSSAGILFLCALVHGIITVYLFLTQTYYKCRLSVTLKIIPTVIIGLCIIGSMVLHPTVTNEKTASILGAVFQWLLVFSMIVLFGSYSVDFNYLCNDYTEVDEQRNGINNDDSEQQKLLSK